jgi:hypothetical protein
MCFLICQDVLTDTQPGVVWQLQVPAAGTLALRAAGISDLATIWITEARGFGCHFSIV